MGIKTYKIICLYVLYMKYKTYLFDLDGVLINSVEIQHLTIIQAINDVIHCDITIHPNYELILLPIFKSTITTLEKLEILSTYITLDTNTITQIYNKKKNLLTYILTIFLLTKSKLNYYSI
jgi:beta-phosphoglucomutase-like phosphatase (HAD superfamily)